MADNCIFCRIVRGELPSTIVYQDEQCICFRDIHPAAPVHVLIVPRTHIVSVADIDGENAALAGHLLAVAAKVAHQEHISSSGFRVVTNTGKEGGQSVDHLHLHVLGGRQFSWPPG
jgi:histidine triad (HIT) family protein